MAGGPSVIQSSVQREDDVIRDWCKSINGAQCHTRNIARLTTPSRVTDLSAWQ